MNPDSSTVASSSQSEEGGVDKYDGLLERSLYARFRESMVTLMNYLDTVSPTFDGVNSVVGVLRVVQFIATCLCTGYQDLWSEANWCYKIVAYLSIASDVVPAGSDHSVDNIISLVASILQFLTLVILAGSAVYVQKTATLPAFLPPALTIWISIGGNLLQPIALRPAGRDLGRWLMGDLTEQVELALFASIFSVVCCIVFLVFYCEVIAPSLKFRPAPLLTVASLPANFFQCLRVKSQ
jgi:hypothetical protein